MSNVTRIFAALVVGVALASSAASAKDPSPSEAGAKASVTGPRLTEVRAKYPRYVPSKSQQDGAFIFDQGKLQRYDLWLEDAQLAEINANPAAEKYVEGALVHNGRVLPAVGIRYKGNRGAFFGCLDGPDPFVPSGAKTCSKLSVKIKIDWADSGDTFYGLKKLNFQANNLDPTMMRERLGYWLFNRFGVSASRSVHAKLYINGEFNGVFTLTEEIDDRFVKRAFQGGRGNLYKEIWPIDDKGHRRSDADFVAALRANTKKAQVADFASFAQAVEALDPNQGRDKTDAMLRQWFDVDRLVRYMVVDRSILADDGIFHWWCFDAVNCNNQNYYWYQDPKSKKVALIPWDLDLAFENLGEPKHPVTPIGPWNKTENDCKPFPMGPYRMVQRSAACDKLIGAFTIYDKEFERLQAEFKRKHYNAATIGKLLDTWAAQIEPAVAEGSAKHADQASVEKWRAAVAKLRGDIEASLR